MAILKPREDYYTRSHPTAADVLLIIEVAETTQRDDREIKAPLYARHDVPEVWRVDWVRKRLEVFREPDGGAYRVTLEPEAAATMSPNLLGDLLVRVGELFAPLSTDR